MHTRNTWRGDWNTSELFPRRYRLVPELEETERNNRCGGCQWDCSKRLCHAGRFRYRSERHGGTWQPLARGQCSYYQEGPLVNPTCMVCNDTCTGTWWWFKVGSGRHATCSRCHPEYRRALRRPAMQPTTWDTGPRRWDDEVERRLW